jgi:CRP/FNR family transcriptional regulator, cyclic AMP receptor protein
MPAGLEHSTVFAGLDPERLEAIWRSGRTVRFSPGDLAIEEGRPNDRLFVVLRGELEVYLPKTPERLTRISIARVGQGDCIGEYSFLDDRPTSASVAATAETEVFEISQAELERLLEGDAAAGQVVYRNLLHLLVGRLRAENQLLNLWSSASAKR